MKEEVEEKVTDTIVSEGSSGASLEIGKAMTVTLTDEERGEFRIVLGLWNDAGLPVHGMRMQIIHRGITLALDEYRGIAERQLRSIAGGACYEDRR